MNKNDIVSGLICQAKNNDRKIRILTIEPNDMVVYEPMIFGNQDIKYIKLDKLLENFKKFDEC